MGESVMWIVCFLLSILILTSVSAAAVFIGGKDYKPGRFFTPFRLFYAAVLISVFICILPVYTVTDEFPGHVWDGVLFTLHHTLQVFTLDADRNAILEAIANAPHWITGLYSGYMSLIFVAGPLLTVTFLISFIRNASAYFRTASHYFSDTYVFSDLNERSLALARDIRKQHPNVLIVFTDVYSDGDEISTERIEETREIKACCFKKDIQTLDLSRKPERTKLFFFIMGKDESENITQSLTLIERYRERKNSILYVFSTGIESELLLSKANGTSLKIHRIDEVRSLIYHNLYLRGHCLFENALPSGDGQRKISAVIVGMGQYGTEMLKALTWYCQMDGYHIQIDAFDSDKQSGERFSFLCPELVSPEYNGVSVPGEAEYTISLHPDVDVRTSTFAKEIYKLKDTTYVLISLGSDELNIRTAVEMRMLFERMHISPTIQAIVYNSSAKQALAEAANYRGQRYRIDFIGDTESLYAEDVIINSQLEQEALKSHLRWGKEDEFWQYEYNYRSSVASALHKRARIKCGIPGALKSASDLTDEERRVIESLEHRRWNAYMRAEGYIYSGSPDKTSRNDLGKMHHDLVPYEKLDETEKRKDSAVATA